MLGSICPLIHLQTHMWNWLCWTQWDNPSPNAGRLCPGASLTPRTRRPLCSRWHFSSYRRSRWSCLYTASVEGWVGGDAWAGSPWALTAPGRRSSHTGPRWRRLRVSRCAGGTHSWSPSRRCVDSKAIDYGGFRQGCLENYPGRTFEDTLSFIWFYSYF